LKKAGGNPLSRGKNQILQRVLCNLQTSGTGKEQAKSGVSEGKDPKQRARPQQAIDRLAERWVKVSKSPAHCKLGSGGDVWVPARPVHPLKNWSWIGRLAQLIGVTLRSQPWSLPSLADLLHVETAEPIVPEPIGSRRITVVLPMPGVPVSSSRPVRPGDV